MGFTPLEGLVLGSRSGSLDPGLLIYLLKQGYTPEQLDRTLNKESGLKGISGKASDLRTILQDRAAGEQRATLAFDVFVHSLRRHIGAMLAVLGGLDALIFTGGMGEHSADLRAAACSTLGFLGLSIDQERNAHVQGDMDIAASNSSVRVLVIGAQEDWMIARECWHVLAQTA